MMKIFEVQKINKIYILSVRYYEEKLYKDKDPLDLVE